LCGLRATGGVESFAVYAEIQASLKFNIPIYFSFYSSTLADYLEVVIHL
jgi:hypothetical protein